MPINPPRLDDRGFDDLVAELIARVPAHTPEWMPQVGDPGRTLIDLFAWLGDTLLYRANLIPERQRLVFLKLLGMQLRPAIPARGIVTVARRGEEATAVTIARGAQLGGPPSFETQRELTVLPIEARVYAKRRLDPAQELSMSGVLRDLMTVYRALHPEGDGRTPVGYVTSEVFPKGMPGAGSFDLVEGTADRALWIALLAPSPAQVEAVRTTLADGRDGRPFTLSMGLVPEVEPVERLEDLQERRPRRTVFEVLTNELSNGRHVFSALDVRADTTAGLRRDGVVELSLMASSLGVPTNDAAASPGAGMGELPPRIDAPEDAARVVGWLRFRPTERLNALRLHWLGAHAVEIEQTRTVTNLVVATSTGTTDQVVDLGATSVNPQELRLEILGEDGRYEQWLRVDDIAAAGRDDQVFVLDTEAGTVRFGDSVRGKVPPTGARIRVGSMKSGGGRLGNLPAGTLGEILAEDENGDRVHVPLRVQQPMPTRGGVEAETLLQAEQRIPATLRHRNRAVTTTDYRTLASTVPGVRVGRVEVLPRFKPHQRRPNVPGVVSLIAIPAVPRSELRAPAPRGDRHFIESVHMWMDERRTLGTELYVINPEYVPIAVSVGVELRNGFPVEQTLAAVRMSLRAFFWPLPPYGPAGRGWPLGTTVSAPQAEVAVARTAGVSMIRGLRLFAREDQWQPAPAGEVRLQPWQLPELMHVVTVAGTDAPTDPRAILDALAADSLDPFAGDGGQGGAFDPVPIPVVPEVC